jgi:hypothetical protein
MKLWHHRLVYVLLAACLLTQARAQSAAPPVLADGEAVTLQGTLQVVHQGWKPYVVLKTAQRYTFRFNPPADAPAPTDELQLVMDWEGESLAQHAGEPATATGSILLNPYTGYYFNGAAIDAKKITLANGTAFAPLTGPKLPTTITRYLASVTLDPHANAWQRSAIELPSGRALTQPQLDGCATNGAGDLLNCGCGEGFAVARAGHVPTNAPLTAGRVLPRVADGLAQIPLPDAATHPFTVQVLCTRQKADTN